MTTMKSREVDQDMISREEFEAYKMKTEVWKARLEERMNAVETNERMRSERDILIIESLARLEARQDSIIEHMKMFQETVGTAIEKMTDKLADHIIESR